MPEPLRKHFAELMNELADQDPELVVMVGDISHGIMEPFRDKAPGRYFNIGILEPSMVGIAAGMNMVGLNPVVHTIAPFLVERTFEQLKLDFGYQELSVNLVSVGASFDYSQLGVSHHSYNDVSLVGSIPNSKVFLPGSRSEFYSLFKSNYRSQGVKYFRLTEVPHSLDASKLGTDGSASVLRVGEDLTLVCNPATVELCLTYADKVQGPIEVEVVYVNSIKPFDSGTIAESASKTRRVLSVEELSDWDGMHNRVLQSIQGLPGIVAGSVAVAGYVREYGSRAELHQYAGITLEKIAEEAGNLGLFSGIN